MTHVALLTGAARGIGAAIARRLADDGAGVAVCDIDDERAQMTARAIRDDGGRAIAVAADVTDAGAVADMVSAVSDQLGEPDILVNGAGVISTAPFLELTEHEWDRIIAVNLRSQYLCTRAVLPAMRRGRWGRVVNIASDAGKTGEPFVAHYCASKFGVIGLTQSLALEFATDGITVNAICPAITDTDMMQQIAEELEASSLPEPPGGWRQQLVDEIPLGRPMHPDEIAQMCAFLVSEGAGAISGQAINVSGAHEMH